MERVRNPEELKQIQIADLEKRIAGMDQLISKNLVPSIQRERMIADRAVYLAELKGLKGESENQEPIAA